MSGKRLLASIILSLSLFFGFTKLSSASELILFYGQGCSHCAKVLSYLAAHPSLSDSLSLKEIYFDQNNAALYNAILDQQDVPLQDRGVPLLIIGDSYLVGDRPIMNYLSTKLAVDPSPSPELLSPTPTPSPSPPSTSSQLTLMAVLLAALVDAINPCAFAVLIILMTTVLASGQAKRALLTGLAFATSIFLSYLLMGLGLYQALSFGNLGELFFRIVGYLAIFLGLLNLKDFFWYGKVVLMEVPLSWRPHLKSLLHSVTSPHGAFGIGFLVSLFLLPCTSGPYLVILGMLANTQTRSQALLYLIFYNLVFISPMLLITYLVSRGLDPAKLEQLRQQRLRTLHLLAGLILLGMGLMLVLGWV